MTEFDLVIRGGHIVDGTGSPPYKGDVALIGARIAAVGNIRGNGRTEIDANGLHVTPGFVDIHTHLDGQAVWEERMKPTSWHGVTTVLMGNCGVGFAPVKDVHREGMIALMEGVEDIPNVCLTEGLDWSWETFEEYLEALERRPHDVDLCTLLPHAAMRVYVMGQRALDLEESTEEDNERMRDIVRRAMKAGAFGVSTSRMSSHQTLAGSHTPTLHATERELLSITLGMKDAGYGVLQLISEWDAPDARTEFQMFRRVLDASGRPGLMSVTQRYHQPEVWRELLTLSREALADGTVIRPIVAPRPIGVLFGLEGTQNPFTGTRTYQTIANLPLTERVAAMRKPQVKRAILNEDPLEFSTFSLLPRLSHDRVFRFGNPPNYQPSSEESAAAIGRRENKPTAEVVYDMLLEDDGKALLFSPIVNYMNNSMDACREMVNDRNALFGLGDGGAHVGFITDASFPTYLLSYWARDAEEPLDLADVVHRLTDVNARAIGLYDRGRLLPGYKADINLLDLEKLAIEKPYLTHDLPAGGTRLMQKARGIAMTIMSGVPTYQDGEPLAALPGQVMRGPQAAPVDQERVRTRHSQ